MVFLCSFRALLTKWPRPFYGLDRTKWPRPTVPLPVPVAQATRLITTIDCCVNISEDPQPAAGLIPSIWRRRSPPEASPRTGHEILGDGRLMPCDSCPPAGLAGTARAGGR